MSQMKWIKILGTMTTISLLSIFNFNWLRSIYNHGYVRFVVYEYSSFYFILEGILFMMTLIANLIIIWEVIYSE